MRNAPRVWTEEKLNEAARLWSQGLTATRIAELLGVTEGSFRGTSSLQRDRFPTRVKSKPEAQAEAIVEAPLPIEKPKPAVRRTYIAGKWVEHVKRKTITGAVVTVARVEFIDGAREMAD